MPIQAASLSIVNRRRFNACLVSPKPLVGRCPASMKRWEPMRNGRVADLFRVRERFHRSIHLERDFREAAALRGYVITPHTRTSLNRLAGGLSPESGQRAWRITGDYGSGKSSFALALAHLLSGREQRLPEQLRHVVDFRRLGGRPNLLPILVTGSRAPLA